MPDAPTQSAAVELRCPECDYNLTVAASARCPSCGWLIDAAELVSSLRPRFGTQRIGIIVAAAVLSGGSFVAIMLLGTGRKLELLDGVALFAILLAAGGHAALAVAAGWSGRAWPMRLPELRAVLTMAGCVSVVAALIGATQALDFEPTPRVVKGVKVNGALEFALTTLLFTFPGLSLLLLRCMSFRSGAPHSGPGNERERAPARSGKRAGAPFIVEFARVFRREQITQRVSSTPRPRSAALEAAVARIWESELALAVESDRELYNGELGRFIGAEVGEDSLCLEMGCTSYREFLGTNLFNADAVRREGVEHFADPLGVSVVVVTLDNCLVLGRRGRRVAFHAGWLHPFGGMLESSDRRPDGTYDLFGCAGRELMEELGARMHELSDLIILGLVRDRAIHQPELIFRVRITLRRSELDAVFDPRLSGGEHNAVEYVSDTPDAIITSIESADSMTPVAQASLLLHGRDRWGDDWYTSACRRLYEWSHQPQAISHQP